MNAPIRPRTKAPPHAGGPRTGRAARMIVAVSDDAAVREAMNRAVADRRDADLVIHPSAALGLGDAFAGAEAVFAHVTAAASLTLEEMSALARIGAEAPLILILDELDTVADARLALRLQAVDLLVTPLPADQLAAALNQALERPGHTPADVTAVLSAVGGAGGTSLAITLADHLANRPKEAHGTALIDLDTLTGACGLHLDAQCTTNVAEDASDLHRVDADYLDVAMKTVDALGVLSIRAANQREGENAREVILRALDILEREKDCLVLDVPHWAAEQDLAMLAAVNRVFLVTLPTVPALKLAWDKVDRLEALGCPRSAVTIVVNRVKSHLFASKLDKKVIGRMLHGMTVAEVRDDEDTLLEAANCGMPPRAVARRSVMVKDTLKLYRDVLSREAAAAPGGGMAPAPSPSPAPAAATPGVLSKLMKRDKAGG